MNDPEHDRRVAFEYFGKMTPDEFRRRAHETNGFHGQLELEKYAPEWLAKIRREEAEAQRLEDRAVEDARHKRGMRHDLIVGVIGAVIGAVLAWLLSCSGK